MLTAIICAVSAFQIEVATVHATESDAKCFTLDQCKGLYETNRNDVSRNDKERWTFDKSEHFEARPNECKGVGEQGYCYPPNFSYDLIVDLGSVGQVEGIHGYVKAVYSLAIVFGVLGTVITVMIAGFQWMTARGNPTAASKAKQTLGRGVMSMIILLSIVTLARIIDPQLAVINPLKTPLVKQVNYVDENSTCEYLVSEGFEVKPKESGKNKCGDKGIIEKLPETKTNEGVAFIGAEVGKECVYTGCDVKKLEACAFMGTEYKCLRCGNADDYTAAGFTPSEQSCRSLTLSPSAASWPDDLLIMCRYHNSPWSDPLSLTPDTCIEIVYPWRDDVPGLYCDQLKSAFGDDCSAYDSVAGRGRKVKGTYYGTPQLGGAWLNSFYEEGGGYKNFEEVCAKDICGLTTTGCKVEVTPAGWVSGEQANCVAR